MAKAFSLCLSAYCLHKVIIQQRSIINCDLGNEVKFGSKAALLTKGPDVLYKDKLVNIFAKSVYCQTKEDGGCTSCKKSCQSCDTDNENLEKTKETWKKVNNSGKVLRSKRMKALLTKITSATASGKYTKEVDTAFLSAIRFAAEQKDLDAIMYVQDLWANYCMYANNLGKAEVLLKARVQNLINSGLDTNDPVVIEASLKLATIYAHRGDHEKAESGYSWAIKSGKDRLKTMKKNCSEYSKTLKLLGMTLDSYSRYLYLSGKNEEALKLSNEALEISLQLYGEESSQSMVLYNSIATIYITMGDTKNALTNVKHSYELSESKGVSNEERAVICHNYGYILSKVNRISDAKSKLTESLRYTKDDRLKNEISRLKSELDKKTE